MMSNASYSALVFFFFKGNKSLHLGAEKSMTPKGHKSYKSSTNIKHLLVTIYGSMTYYRYYKSEIL